MIDSITSLAFSMHSNKGVYALLLGSGISRTAGIPSGWEVTLDLVYKLALMNGQQDECSADPGLWYCRKYGKEPNYTELLDQLGQTPEERQAILRGYFEPSEEEREIGIKLPTVAHKAIAQLVSSGHIRVIITTNFDRLLEQALNDIGIHPNVISTPDAMEGAIPLIHTQHSIIKLHGDYLDCRIKNTEQELASYDDRINVVLDRILDEFGLIVCGWSAEWDVALRNALERCKSRRYAMYWLSVGNLNDAADRLINLRGAQKIPVDGADSFFCLLLDKVTALADIDEPHPLSIKAAVSEVKRYLAEEKFRIKLYDLVIGETERVISGMSGPEFDLQEKPDQDKICLRFRRYEALTEILQALIVVGCFWGESNSVYLWTKCIERLAGSNSRRNGYTAWLDMDSYPALLLLYAGGIASIFGGRLNNMHNLASLVNTMRRDDYGTQPIIVRINARKVAYEQVKLLTGFEGRKTPMSDHLFEVLRNGLIDLIPDDQKYEECFDKFEYYLALLYADYELISGNNEPWAPTGCFQWRYSMCKFSTVDMVRATVADVETQSDKCLVLQAGMFGGSVDRLNAAIEAVNAIVKRIGW